MFTRNLRGMRRATQSNMRAEGKKNFKFTWKVSCNILVKTLFPPRGARWYFRVEPRLGRFLLSFTIFWNTAHFHGNYFSLWKKNDALNYVSFFIIFIEFSLDKTCFSISINLFCTLWNIISLNNACEEKCLRFFTKVILIASNEFKTVN